MQLIDWLLSLDLFELLFFMLCICICGLALWSFLNFIEKDQRKINTMLKKKKEIGKDE